MNQPTEPDKFDPINQLPQFKVCKICKLEKSLNDYYVRKDNGKHKPNCKSCENEKYSYVAMRKKYGLTQADYDKMLSDQNGRCKICGSTGAASSETSRRLYKTDKSPTLIIDHDHVTGKVRGLLCRLCNTAIAYLKDDLQNFRNAMAYVENSKNAI
jgi:hypothetical protein